MCSMNMLLASCLVGLAVLAIDGSAKDYAGQQVVKVANSSPDVRTILSEMGLDVWGGNRDHLDVQVPQEKLGELIEKLEGVPMRVMIPDLEAAIQSQTRSSARSGRSGEMDWNNYHRLNVIYNWIDGLASKYPGRVSVGEIGRTHEKRPIKFVKISSGRPGAKAVLIDGGIHAREWVSPASVTWLIRELVENPSSLPQSMGDLDWYIIPVLNPDGYEYSHLRDRMWRKNRSPGRDCPGSDINRNFDHMWQYSGTSTYSCDENFGGSHAASELETQALKNFAHSIPDLKAYVTFHSYGQMILYPYSHKHNSYPRDIADLRRVAEQARQAISRATGARYDVGTVPEVVGYPSGGGTIDWMKEFGKVKYAFGMELRDTGSYGFLLPARSILPTAREALEFVKAVSAAAVNA